MKRLAMGALLAATASMPLIAAVQPAPADKARMEQMHAMMKSIKADQVVTRAEASTMVRAHFAARDANKDGVLSGDELKGRRMMAMHGMHGMADGHAMGPDAMKAMPDPKIAFDRMDTNKDGMISRDEFSKGRQLRIERIIERRGDGPGMAGGNPRGDMKMRGMHRGMGMMALHRLGKADANKDGRVTLAEAEAGAMAMFTERDANKDGKLTRDEMRGARMMMRSKAKMAG